MDVEDAYSRLPETHAAALRLRARGFDHDAIAATLGLEPSAVRPLLQIAEAKLEALKAANDGAEHGHEPSALPTVRFAEEQCRTSEPVAPTTPSRVRQRPLI